MKIIYSPHCLEYQTIGHPESPARVKSSAVFLKKKGYQFITPKPCLEQDILLVHDQTLVQQVQKNDFFDPDTPNLEMYGHAQLAVGAALEAAALAWSGESSFSLMRPPGHHAGRSFLGGFCYFNNLAVAVKKIMAQAGRVAILDIDCHHGNGIEDIFLGHSKVLYVSLHQSPLYPGTGLESKLNVINFPLPAGANEEKYLKTLDLALEKIKAFKPKLLAVSAGFDTYQGDPLTQMGLEISSYQIIGQKIAGLSLPVFSVLEGGYAQSLPECIDSFLIGLSK